MDSESAPAPSNIEFISNKNPPFRTPEVPTTFGQVSRATALNQMNGIRIAQTKSSKAQGTKLVHTALSQIPPHLRHANVIVPPPTSVLNKKYILEAPELETWFKVMPPPPYLTATTLSNLSISSELNISDVEGIMPVGNDKLPAEAMAEAEAETKPIYASQQNPKHKEPAKIDGNQIIDESIITSYPPHLRTKRGETIVPIVESMAIMNRAKYQKGACSLNTTSAPVLHQTPKLTPSYSMFDGRHKAFPATSDNSIPRTSLASSTDPNPTPTKPISDMKPLHAPRIPLTSQKTSSAWSNFAAAPGGRSTEAGRTNPLTVATGGYGVPITPRVPIAVNPALQKTLFFQSWPEVEDRGHTSRSRTIIITGLPEDPTLPMISRICKDTGLLETISLIPISKKALVWYIKAEDAKKFYDKTGNGIVLEYEKGGIKLKKTVFVEIKKEVDVLPSALRAKVDEGGHTRVIRIVGWQIDDLNLILGIKCTGQEDSEMLLRKLAEKCAFEGKIERIESATSHTNALGYLEASLIFSGIKEAYFALGQLRKMPALEACNITFGKDPCEHVLGLNSKD